MRIAPRPVVLAALIFTACGGTRPAATNGSTGAETTAGTGSTTDSTGGSDSGSSGASTGSAAASTSSGSSGSGSSSAGSSSSGTSSTASSSSSSTSTGSSSSASSGSSGSSTGSTGATGSSGSTTGGLGLTCTSGVRGFGVPEMDLPLQPYGVTLADLNGDGILDEVVSSFASGNNTLVMLGYGDGTFAAPFGYPGPSQASRNAVADFNGDGKPDLAIAGINGTGLTVYFGSGTGTFGGERSVTTISEVIGIGTADFNGDGRPDIAEVSNSTGQVALVLTESDGGFAPAQRYPATASGVSHSDMAIADLSGDGVPDIAVVNNGSPKSLTIFLGTGSGLAQQASDVAMGVQVSAVAAADFTGDGKVDLAVSTSSTTVKLLVNQGNATFASPVDIASDVAGTTVRSADFDGDGNADLLVVAEFSAEVLYGDGHGGFARRQLYPSEGGTWPAIGDLDGDGRPDVVIPDVWGNRLQTLLANPDGTLLGGLGVHTGTTSPGGQAFADFNEDGMTDLAVSVPDGTLDLVLATAPGRFGAAQVYSIGANKEAFEVVSADFNGDGHADVATANELTNDVTVFLGNGRGGLSVPVSYPAGSPVGSPRGLAALDVDGDGKPDLVLSDYSLKSLRLLTNNGDGTFGAPTTIALPSGSNPYALLPADFNGDGRTDLLVTDIGTTRQFLVLLNQNGTLSALTATPSANMVGVAVGDYDRDGKLDVATWSTAGLRIFLGQGTGNFTPTPLHAIASTSVDPGMAAGDFDGDGVLDLAAGHQVGSGDYLVVMKGYPDAGFAAPVDFASAGPKDILAGDVDGDGLSDLSVLENAGAQVDVWRASCWR